MWRTDVEKGRQVLKDIMKLKMQVLREKIMGDFVEITQEAMGNI